jgi:hypothetical protein
MAGMGQYSATLNATTPYHLGAEHLGYTVYGTVVDTTAGANLARVGWIQKTLVTAGYQVKWVWPKILVTGHAYEMAMFEDHLKNQTCGPMDRTWIIQIPQPTADFVFNWKQPVPYTTGTCTDFPVGPLP